MVKMFLTVLHHHKQNDKTTASHSTLYICIKKGMYICVYNMFGTVSKLKFSWGQYFADCLKNW